MTARALTRPKHRSRWERLADRPITPKQLTFVIEYMKDRNAVAAYERAGYSGDVRNAHALLNSPRITAEVNKRLEAYSVAAGIERIDLLEKLKLLIDVRYRDFFNPGGGIKSPEEWPTDADDLITGYNSGTANAAEKIAFKDKVQMIFDLLNEIKPVGQRKGDVPPPQVFVLDFDGMVQRLKKRGEIIDVTPT
jgi:hypothetical protein